MPCEMGEKFPGPPMPQTYWEDGFRKAAEMFPMQPNERAEVETLRSQIASLRALAKTWEDKGSADRRAAERTTTHADEIEALAWARAHESHAKAIRAIVGKE